MPAYDAMVEQSNKVGWPTIFRSDLLFHDRQILSRIPSSMAFGWILRECGTEFVSPYQTPDSWGTILIKVYTGRARFFWYNGYTLLEVEPENFKSLVLQIYHDRLSDLVQDGHSPAFARMKAKQEVDAMHNKAFENVSMSDLPTDWTE